MPIGARTSAAKIVAVILLGGGLASCAHYQAAPLDLTASATVIESRRLPAAPAETLSYGQALKLALANAATVNQSRAAYASAVAAARTTRVRPAMTLTLTAEYSKDSDPQRPWLYGGVLDVPLDSRGVRGGRIGAADLAILKARYDVIEAVWAARMALRRALLDREAARLELATANRQVELRRQLLAILQRRVERGEDARSTALLAATELATSNQRQRSAAGAADQADVALAAALGVTVEAMAGVEIAPAPEWSPGLGERVALRRDAAVGRADVLRAVVDYDIAEQGLRTAVAGQYPQVTFSPGYTWERGLTKLPFSLGLALPPTDLNRSAIREAEVRRAEASAALETVQATIFAQTDAAAAALESAVAVAVRIEAQDLQLARRAVELTNRAVVLGENDRTDALRAQAAVVDAELAAVDALRLHNAALADLEAATRHTADPAELALLSDALMSLEPAP